MRPLSPGTRHQLLLRVLLRLRLLPLRQAMPQQRARGQLNSCLARGNHGDRNTSHNGNPCTSRRLSHVRSELAAGTFDTVLAAVPVIHVLRSPPVLRSSKLLLLFLPLARLSSKLFLLFHQMRRHLVDSALSILGSRAATGNPGTRPIRTSSTGRHRRYARTSGIDHNGLRYHSVRRRRCRICTVGRGGLPRYLGASRPGISSWRS
jgi:hypothetical protein